MANLVDYFSVQKFDFINPKLRKLLSTYKSVNKAEYIVVNHLQLD